MLYFIVLTTLFFGPCHGYEIKKMHPGLKINNNTLYPLLKKLCQEGYITMTIQEQENKPSKKIYELTEIGKEKLFELISDFNEDSASSDDAFYLRVAYFQFLSKDTVKKILDCREAYLNRFMHQESLMKLLDKFPDNSYDLLYMKKFFTSKIFNEKQFVSTMREKYEV